MHFVANFMGFFFISYFFFVALQLRNRDQICEIGRLLLHFPTKYRFVCRLRMFYIFLPYHLSIEPALNKRSLNFNDIINYLRVNKRVWAYGCESRKLAVSARVMPRHSTSVGVTCPINTCARHRQFSKLKLLIFYYEFLHTFLARNNICKIRVSKMKTCFRSAPPPGPFGNLSTIFCFELYSLFRWISF